MIALARRRNEMDESPFDQPLGPTGECLSSEMIVKFLHDELDTDHPAHQHIADCSACKDNIESAREAI